MIELSIHSNLKMFFFLEKFSQIKFSVSILEDSSPINFSSDRCSDLTDSAIDADYNG